MFSGKNSEKTPGPDHENIDMASTAGRLRPDFGSESSAIPFSPNCNSASMDLRELRDAAIDLCDTAVDS
jgi:hypothetical protein